jgi:hypothetical protein
MSSTPVTLMNIAFEQGSSYDYVYTWLDSNNNPVNLTGYSARLHVVTDLINKSPILTITNDGTTAPNTSLILGGAAGTIEITATAAATTAMTYFTGKYALLVESGSGVITKLMEGSVVVNAGISW